MKKILKITSIVLSVLMILYVLVAIKISTSSMYSFWYSQNIMWTIIAFALPIAHIALAVLCKSRLVYCLMIVSSFTSALIVPIPSKFKYIVFFVYLLVVLFFAKPKIKMIATIVCCIYVIILFLYIQITDANAWNPHFQTISTEYCLTEDNSTCAKIRLCYTKDVENNTEEYLVYVSFEKMSVIQLGPIEFSKFNNKVSVKQSYQDCPTIDAKWLDNNTFSINGETIVVK